jgi:hypothetical protein
MTYKLNADWEAITDSVRNKTVVSPTPSVVWNSGSKHGLEEGSVSRDIISFIRWRRDQSASRDEILTNMPLAFIKENKIARDLCQGYLRELVKMRILDFIEGV